MDTRDVDITGVFPHLVSLLCCSLLADGYISVMNVELNIKEMLELGKKAQAAGRGGNVEGDNISIGSRYWVAH